MTPLIASQTAAVTSDAFAVSGVIKIIADRLASGESVKLQEETPSGTYIDVVDDKGIGVVLTNAQPSRLVEGYGNYKVVKSVTGEAVAVGYEQ